MQNVLPASLMLIACFPFALHAQSLKPLPTEFVNCVTNQRGVPVQANKQQTPLVKSSTGNVAYGEVRAEALRAGSCQNSTTVYRAESSGSFRPILRQGVERLPDGSVYDGNGVAYLDWSPSGEKLMVVLFQWTYGTDGGGNYKYFLIEEGDHSAKLIFPERAIGEHFQRLCSAVTRFKGWIDNQRIGLGGASLCGHGRRRQTRPNSCVHQGNNNVLVRRCHKRSEPRFAGEQGQWPSIASPEIALPTASSKRRSAHSAAFIKVLKCLSTEGRLGRPTREAISRQ